MSEKEARRTEARSRTFQELLAADAFDEAEMTQVLHASYVWTHKADLLVALSLKGFVFPYKMN
jgi:DNA-binding SARP family transcriptional activator